MTESAVADFVGRFAPPGGGPSSGRIVLSQRRLVLAAADGRRTVPLSSVLDVTVEQVPPAAEGYFNDTVTVAYRDGDERRLVAIEGSGDNIDRFVTVLFKVLLNGTTVRLRHPARIGGRVTATPASRRRLSLPLGSLAFAGTDEDDPVSVDLDDVIAVDRAERDLGDGPRPVISFRHTADGTAVTSEVGLPSGRKTSLLGRYIRLCYADAKAELESFEPTDAEMEVLVALYTAGSDVSLTGVIDVDPQRLTMLLNGLADEGVVVDTDRGTELTAKGRIAVGRRLGSVNA